MVTTKEIKKRTNEAIDMSSNAVKEFMNSAEDLSAKTRDATVEATEKSVEFVKKYPLHTALGAAAVGYLFGLLSSKNNK